MCRRPKFLSPTALMLWERNREEFYLKYLSPTPPPKYAQTVPMAVGSAFDAYIKGYLSKRLFGEDRFEELFLTQVEEQNRDTAITDGADCFTQYKESGALHDLLKILDHATDVQMEYTAVSSNVGNVTLLGKPDLTFRIEDAHIVLDWKVNGYYSKNGVSPRAGYCNLLPDGKMHKNCWPEYIGWLVVNGEMNLPFDWALQLCTYGWLGGIDVGSSMVVLVDQLAVRKGSIRVAQHRCWINAELQMDILSRYEECWSMIQDDLSWISPERRAALDKVALAFEGSETKDSWLRSISGRK